MPRIHTRCMHGRIAIGIFVYVEHRGLCGTRVLPACPYPVVSPKLCIAMRPYLLILLLLSLLPRYVNAGLLHAQNCTMAGSNNSTEVSTHQHQPINISADVHEPHQHHHQSVDADTVNNGVDVDPSPSSSSSSIDCDHCDDCHDHCCAMLIGSLSNARHGSLHDLSMQTGLILVHSYHERISRPPRI